MSENVTTSNERKMTRVFERYLTVWVALTLTITGE